MQIYWNMSSQAQVEMYVQFFEDINRSHEATGYPGRTDLPDFHIFTIEDTYPHTRKTMPPYRFDFYQIVFFENSEDAILNVNTESIQNLSNQLFFASPEHVLTWQRDEVLRGYIVYFKEPFLAQYPRLVTEEFSYFRITELNRVQVPERDKLNLYDHFSQLLQLFQSEHPYRVQMLQAALLLLLFDCKRLHDGQERRLQERSPQHVLAFRFQEFVNQHYQTRKKVSDYAALMAISPDYLAQSVRAAIGKPPLQVIAERILLEAKSLLTYSDLSIGEIANQLGYDELTHFGRFFRRHTGYSPSVWRNQQT